MISRIISPEFAPQIAKCEQNQLNQLVSAFQALRQNKYLYDGKLVLENVYFQLQKFQYDHYQKLKNLQKDNLIEEYPSLCNYFINSYYALTLTLDTVLENYLAPCKEEIENLLTFTNALPESSSNYSATLSTITKTSLSSLLLKTLSNSASITQYAEQHTALRKFIIKKFEFYYTENNLKSYCEIISNSMNLPVSYEEEQFPGELRTVIEHIKYFAEFYDLALNEDEYHEFWASSNEKLTRPLLSKLSKHTFNPIQSTLFKEALSEFRHKKKETKLIQLLKSNYNRNNLVPILYDLIQNGKASTIIEQWNMDNTEEHFRLFFQKKIIDIEILFLENLITALEKILDTDLSYNQYQTLSKIIDTVANSLELLHKEQELENDLMTAGIPLAKKQYNFRDTLCNIISILDIELEKNIKKFNGEIEKTLAADKAILKNFLTPLEKQLSSLDIEPSQVNYIHYNDAISDYINKLNKGYEDILTKVFLQFAPTLVKKFLVKVNAKTGHSFTQEPHFPEGDVLTVVDFIKENSEFFMTLLNGNLRFNLWSQKNIEILSPLYDGMKKCIRHNAHMSQLKEILAEFIVTEDDAPLITFLEQKTKNLDILSEMIFDHYAQNVIQKWQRTEMHYKAMESLNAAISENTSLQDIYDKNPEYPGYTETILVCKLNSKRLNKLKLDINCINPNNPDENDLTILTRISEECETMRLDFKNQLYNLINHIKSNIKQTLHRTNHLFQKSTCRLSALSIFPASPTHHTNDNNDNIQNTRRIKNG